MVDLKMLPAGIGEPPKWFEVESVSDGVGETTIVAKISASSGAVAIPMSYKVHRGVITALDVVKALGVEFPANMAGKGASVALSFLQLPAKIHVTGQPVGPGRAKLTVTCTHAGTPYAWSKDVEYDQVRVQDLAEGLKFLLAVQSGAVKV